MNGMHGRAAADDYKVTTVGHLQMTVTWIELAGLGSLQAFPLILFTKDGEHDGPSGASAKADSDLACRSTAACSRSQPNLRILQPY